MSDAPIRTCYGCGQADDHPKFVLVKDYAAPNDLTDEPYHYDCVPHGIRVQFGLDNAHPAIVATAQGKRGDDVREVMAAHAAELHAEDVKTREAAQ